MKKQHLSKTVVWVMVISALMSRSSDGFLTAKIHVLLTNDLEGGLDLTVHCKSKDDDLGVHVLRPHESYGFSFHERFFGQTLFFCGFRWRGAFHWHDVYVQGPYQCSKCDWSISQRAPCWTNDHKTEPSCERWDF